MKTTAIIMGLLTLFVLNAADASSDFVNSHYVCGPLVDEAGVEVAGSPEFELLEVLVPMGEMLPAFSHVWTLSVIAPQADSKELSLSFQSREGKYPNVVDTYVSNSPYTVKVAMDAAIVMSEEGTASCVSVTVGPQGVCSKDINVHGNPSFCECPDTHKYSSLSGSCEMPM